MPDLIIPPFQPTDSPSPKNTQEQEQVDYSDYSEFTRGVLSSIPETDRPVVAKYIKDWDGNVTRKFQEIHQTYRPYLELGDIEDIQYAKYYTSMMQNDPAQFIRELTAAMKEAGMSTDDLFVNDEQYEGHVPQQQPEVIPREVQSRLDHYEQLLGNVYQQQQSFQQQQIEAQQMAQLDRLMDDMHRVHGDFDDDWFLLQLEKGATPDQAINAYKDRFGSPERKPAPRLLSGNGAVRQDQVDPSKLSDTDRKAYALAILQANQQT
jgi:hypothetical protein